MLTFLLKLEMKNTIPYVSVFHVDLFLFVKYEKT